MAYIQVSLMFIIKMLLEDLWLFYGNEIIMDPIIQLDQRINMSDYTGAWPLGLRVVYR